MGMWKSINIASSKQNWGEEEVTIIKNGVFSKQKWGEEVDCGSRQRGLNTRGIGEKVGDLVLMN